MSAVLQGFEVFCFSSLLLKEAAFLAWPSYPERAFGCFNLPAQHTLIRFPPLDLISPSHLFRTAISVRLDSDAHEFNLLMYHCAFQTHWLYCNLSKTSKLE